MLQHSCRHHEMNPGRISHMRSQIAGCVLLLATGQTLAADRTQLAIDIGHSLASPGATSARGVLEFSFNRELARATARELSRRSIKHALVGKDGKSITLQGRPQAAKKAGANFFLSLHHDSVQKQYLQQWMWRGQLRFHSSHAKGFSLFVSRRNPHPAASLACASAIGSELVRKGFVPSEHHAEDVPGERRQWADRANGVYWFDDLIVLKTASMPAVLFEAGVIVNRDEEMRLASPAIRSSLASSLVAGLIACGAVTAR